MALTYKTIRGMSDVLPEHTYLWQHLEATLRDVAHRYAYQEIRMPILEQTALFKRTVGEVTDIVEKEMYTFNDRNGDSLSLRPEGTASCVRAALQGGLLHNAIARLWYMGPMYRHERPQKGRYRQFHQFSVESFGVPGAAMDVEQLLLAYRIMVQLGLTDQVHLKLNSLGSAQCRARYKEALVAYFSQYQDDLDEDCQRRLHTNPLRILDSKNPAMQDMISAAPVLRDYWSEQSLAHFEAVCEGLSLASVPHSIDYRIVRGLDYYCHTVYEWVTDSLGAQGTVCAGGRYDSLVEQLGGKPVPAVGFSIGLERMILLLSEQRQSQYSPDVYLILVGDAALTQGMVLAEQLRLALPTLKLEVNVHGGSVKSQFKRADKSGAAYALVLAEDEVRSGQVAVKSLREQQPQRLLSVDELIEFLKQKNIATGISKIPGT